MDYKTFMKVVRKNMLQIIIAPVIVGIIVGVILIGYESVTANSNPIAPEPPIMVQQQNSRSFIFSTSSTDPDSERVKYNFSWGDGNYSGWTKYYASGQNVLKNYTFPSYDTFSIRVKSRDKSGHESEWSQSVDFVIPKPSLTFNEAVKGAIIIWDNKTYGEINSQKVMMVLLVHRSYKDDFRPAPVFFDIGFNKSIYNSCKIEDIKYNKNFNPIAKLLNHSDLNVTWVEEDIGKDTGAYHLNWKIEFNATWIGGNISIALPNSYRILVFNNDFDLVDVCQGVIHVNPKPNHSGRWFEQFIPDESLYLLN